MNSIQLENTLKNILTLYQYIREGGDNGIARFKQDAEVLNFLIRLNPVHYIINGYRESIFYNKFFWEHPIQTLYFWGITFAIFALGSVLMYKFKRKFIDMI